MNNTEIETSFLINSFDIDKILQIIKKTGYMFKFSTTKLGNYFFDDFYFDNFQLDLARKKIALRIRIINNNKVKIALKKLKNENMLFSERIELEDYFSEKFLESIIDFLLSDGININIENIHDVYFHYKKNPISFFTSIGLDIIQKRNTSRKIINFNKDSEIFYEFAIDKTSFLFSNHKISFVSLELESKSLKNDKNDYKEIILTLLKNSNENFTIWPFNKLITGFAIEHLFASGVLTLEDLDEKRFLNNSSLEIIQLYLNSSNLMNNFVVGTHD